MAKTTRKPKDEAPSKPAATAAAQPAASGAQQQQAQQPQLVEGQLAGVQLQDGTVVSLGELPEVELRQMAIDMEIVGADTLTIEQLVAAIEAEKVLVEESAGTIDDAQPTRIAGEDDRYQVLLTDGSLAFLEELAVEDLVALAGACLRLSPVGLGGAQFIGMDLAGADGVQIMHSAERGDGSRYVVRRERLDHNGESYALGDVIQFDDDEHALQLLAVGAIAPEVV